MGTGFKHGAGGGNPLNFKVVGNPQPANPKEITIWVDTDQEITGWVFSATEPEAPIEGMVWFTVGFTCAVEFNALKKNGIQVYPLSSSQYIGGSFVKKTSKTFKNGGWKDWMLILFGDGTYTLSDFSVSSIGYGGSASMNADGTMKVSVNGTYQGTGSNTFVTFKNRKFSGYNTLEIVCSCSSGSGTTLILSFGGASVGTFKLSAAKSSYKCDISSTTEGSVQFSLNNDANIDQGDKTMTVYELKLY